MASEKHQSWDERFRAALDAGHPGRASMILAEQIDLVHTLHSRKMEGYRHTYAVLEVVQELGYLRDNEKDLVNLAHQKADEMDEREAKAAALEETSLRHSWNPVAGLQTAIGAIAKAFTGSNRRNDNRPGL